MAHNESKFCNCLYYSANALAREMTKMADASFASTGLSSSYAFLVMTVADRPGIQPKGICKQMQLTPSTVTRLIEKMEYKGLLRRDHVGRTTEVYTTREGKELAPKIKEAWKNLYNRYVEIFGKEESTQLTEMINQAMGQLEENT